MVHLKRIILFVIPVLLFGSCLKDELEPCGMDPDNLRYISLKSGMRKYNYEHIVKEVDVYLYDDNDFLVDLLSYSKEELKKTDYRIALPIAENQEYSAVVLVNKGDSYEIDRIDQQKEFYVSLKSEAGDTVRTRQADLFTGFKVLDFGADALPEGMDDRCDTVILMKATNHFDVTVDFKGYTLPTGSRINTYIKGNNGSANYQTRCHKNSQRIYMPLPPDDGSVMTDNPLYFTTMKIWHGSDLTLYVEELNENDQLVKSHQMLIVDRLAQIKNMDGEYLYNTDDKLDQEDQFVLNLELDDRFVLIGLSINGWSLIESGIVVD
ncbi:FimB/Mfa2 family fimbrial subunit [Parabacteroides sp. PF5-9]|uniref:FimB/Mfa2 family fimbrial subunit n=1 Tax=Parabacteroides sp. PF5-9 TaxID=1742404 RepID=UPI002474ECDE|nr:FimB/Mfa2 family fimbrial subunit [Parabacteroides sp. PF5-9]MDH6358993.1 hypothetical protein [Parabacteroides sp. PF5-9]